MVPLVPETVVGVPAEVQFQLTEPAVGMTVELAVPLANTAVPFSGFMTIVLPLSMELSYVTVM